MTDRENAMEVGAVALRDLLATLEMMGQCQGNKAKLDLAEIAIARFQELHELCESYRFSIAVGVDVISENIVQA